MFSKLFGGRKDTGPNVQSHKAHAEPPDWSLLSRTSVFDISELKRLYLRYTKCCLDDGLISQGRFMYMPELGSCPFAAMAFGHEMEQEKRDHLGFPHFVRILSKLSTKSTPMEKVEYLYDVLQIDFDNRNLLEKPEVLVMYKHLLGGTLNPKILEQIVEDVWHNLTNENAGAHHHVDVLKGIDGIDRAVLTSHLCSLDIQNFLTVQF